MDIRRFPEWGDVFQILLTLLAVQLQICASVNNGFTQLDECICPGFNLTFECSILGSGLTVWQGSAFDCVSLSHQILLSHNRFEDAIGHCNSGGIVASSISVVPASNGTDDQCFISQLRVAVTDAMRNKTVECIHDQPRLQPAVIGNTTLIFTTESYPPPDNIHFASYTVNPNTMIFAWDPILTNCSTLNYTIISTNNCGRCLPPASNTSTVCTDVPLSLTGHLCSFAVRTDVCGRIAGRESEPILVQFQDPPTLKVVPYFSCIDQTLTINITFNKTDDFNIAEGYDGSATSYTLTYTSYQTCGTDTIPASACIGLICTHTLRITPSSPCLFSSGGVSITVFATNVLGEGPLSDSVVLIIPECNVSAGDHGNSGPGPGVVMTLPAIILIVTLLMVSAALVFLIVVVIIILRRYLQIKKELVKGKESPTYEEIDISIPAEIGTEGNISYSPVSRKIQ